MQPPGGRAWPVLEVPAQAEEEAMVVSNRVENMVCPHCSMLHGQEHREGCCYPDSTSDVLVLNWKLDAVLAELYELRRVAREAWKATARFLGSRTAEDEKAAKSALQELARKAP